MGNTKFQYLATFIVNLLAMTYGIACGWVSPNLPFLSSDATPLDAKLTVEEASMIAALICAGGLVGNWFFAWISDRIGRRYPLMLIAVPQIIGWILILYARNAFHLYVARFALGLVGGGVFVITPAFISEIADDRVRGTLGSSLVLTANFGGLLGFIFGDYCNYDTTPLIVIAMTLVFLGGFFFFPETPAVLIKMNRMKEAEQSIRFYRNYDLKSKTEMEILRSEMNKLQLLQEEAQARCSAAESKLRWSDFTTTVARKAMVIGLILSALNQLCGVFAMVNYTATIFQEAGSDLAPNSSAIVVGAIQLFGAYLSTILVDRAGRKILLSLSLAAAGLGLACLGTYLYLKSIGYDAESYGWVPISCFSFIVFFANWGILTLPFLVMSEILPEKIKNAGTSISMSVLWVLAFIMVKYFPMISVVLGMHGSMFIFSGFSIVGVVFVMTMMPETKGKSTDEIMHLLSR